MASSVVPSSTLRFLYPGLLAVIWGLSLVEFFITTVLVSDYENNDYPSNSLRDRLRFLLFTSCWTLLFVPIYILVNLRAAGHVLGSITSNLAFNLVTWLFWFAGTASWTDALGGTLNCGQIFLANQAIDFSIPYCHSLKAVQAFAWMIWILYTGVLVSVGVTAAKAGKSQGGLRGPMREVSAA